MQNVVLVVLRCVAGITALLAAWPAVRYFLTFVRALDGHVTNGQMDDAYKEMMQSAAPLLLSGILWVVVGLAMDVRRKGDGQDKKPQ